VKVADAESPAELPVTVIVYEPCEADATVKDAETAPLFIEQVSDATTDPPDNAHEVSLDENPEPDTCTIAPTPALGGFTVIVGIAELTRKLADAESPPGLATTVMV
jgi:hypothetical protein